MIQEGQQAPLFTLPDETGTPVRLADFKDGTVVLWFYVKDDTPG